MKVEDLIIELREVIDDAKTLPLSGGKSVIDADHIKEILDDIEETLPQEVRQAKAIVADRAQIISDAKKEGESILRSAEERRKRSSTRMKSCARRRRRQAKSLPTQSSSRRKSAKPQMNMSKSS